jgi:hypothetical protein
VRAADMRTLSAAGVETEAHLPLSGLHQLLRPVLAGVGELPLPQREALESAFGLVAGGAPDLFLIALASLSLLSDAASREPLLVVVEDAHWLDRATAEALAFVGRRLQSDPVVLLVVVRDERDTPFAAAGLAQMRLERLPQAAAEQLLDDQHPGLDQHVRQRVLELSLGNPLALSELPRALAPEQLTGGRELPAELPLGSRLEHAFAARVAELAPGCQTAMLIAALNDTDLLGETLHAANMLGGDRVSRETLGPARLSGLVELAGDQITFRHPLIRSAIRQAASDADRRAAYAALAEAVGGDPDRRAWHRAAAVSAPDEVVACELEHAAGRAQQRGSLSAAISGLLRAAELSEDPVSRARRLLSAAEFGLDIGQTGLARRLLRQIEGTPLQGRDEGRVILLRETVAPVVGGDPSTVATIAAVAQRMIDGGDADLGLRMLLAAAMSASWIDRDDSKRQLLAASRRLGVDERDPRLLAIVAHAAPVETARRVIELATSWPADPASESDSMHLLGLALGAVGAFVGAEDYLTVAAERMRDAGRLRPLVEVLHLRGYANYLLGRWDQAIADPEESTRIVGVGDLP